MNEQNPKPMTTTPVKKSRALMRRGILASSVALAAGMAARLGAPGRVEASNGNPVLQGAGSPTNDYTAQTTLTLTNAAPSGTTAFRVNNQAAGSAISIDGRSTGGFGVYGDSSSNSGVSGFSATNIGVYGLSSGAAGQGTGVFGDSSLGIGVQARSNNSGIGLKATAVSGRAVEASSNSNNGVYASSNTDIGIYGISLGAVGVGVGVFGDCSAGNGVQGRAQGGGNGVYGVSTSGIGVVGTSANIGVQGFTAAGIGVYGSSTTGIAGRFDGAVQVNGDFNATGIKSALVPNADGVHRRLYCQESPEPWFEDFGEATLTNGICDVRIDADYAETVKTEKYQVFLTEYGDSGGLFVVGRSEEGFRVQARNGASNAGFGYRIVARRKDIKGTRLERVKLKGDNAGNRIQAPNSVPAPANPPVKLPPAPARTNVPTVPAGR